MSQLTHLSRRDEEQLTIHALSTSFDVFDDLHRELSVDPRA
jgi:hypothetical protein